MLNFHISSYFRERLNFLSRSYQSDSCLLARYIDVNIDAKTDLGILHSRAIANRVLRLVDQWRSSSSPAAHQSAFSRHPRYAERFCSFRERANRAQPHPSRRDKCNFYFRLRTRPSRLVSFHLRVLCSRSSSRRSSVWSPRKSTSRPTIATCAPQFYIIRGVSFVCRMSIQNLNTFGE